VLQKREEKQFEQGVEDAVTKYSSNPDRENRDLRLLIRLFVTSLLQIQRIKHLLARDCYFTAKGAEAGDPYIVVDFIRQTTDSKGDLANS
jgi:hypothetical protein